MVTRLTLRTAASRRLGASLRYCVPGCASSARSRRVQEIAMNIERERLLANVPGHDGWQHWGPYLSERQWGTVREDYSPGGTAWEYFPHDHARSRAYRWGEAVLAPAIRAAAGVIVRKIFPRGAAGRIILAHRAPLPLGQIWPPAPPVLPAGLVFRLALFFSASFRRKVRRHGI